MTSRAAETDYSAFIATFPDYAATEKLDTLRRTDFARLDANREVYLDYTGGGLYGESQITHHAALLKKEVFGNPHSTNPTSHRSTVWMERTRDAVLAFFNAPPDDYTVIFTPNASGALRVVGEAYPFTSGGAFLQLVDNHNSVNGIREFAKKAGASVSVVRTEQPNLHVTASTVTAALARHGGQPHLFAYPAQSNFSGVQHSLDWIRIAHAHGWDVLLDAAAFAPTNPLDINKWQPDFVCLSFYKMFGWPTGAGCLIAKKTALAKLHRPWFAGGTILAVSAQGGWHVMASEHEAFEDGTVNYLCLPAVKIGLDYLAHIGISTIHTRVMCLTGWVLQHLRTLTHSNGRPQVVIYGPPDITGRGGTIAFNFLDKTGRIIDERHVERIANEHGISLRTGCFCNPGAGEIAFGLSPATLVAVEDKVRAGKYDEYLRELGLQSGGAIRISFGLASNFADAQAFLAITDVFKDILDTHQGRHPRKHC